VRLVSIRNPWGKEKWHGAWSKDSKLWTAPLKKEAGEKGEDEGIFYMSIEDFRKWFESTTVSYDTTGWHTDSFLKLDDPTKPNGEHEKCGPKCTKHTLEITSKVDQTVFLAAHTWDKRGIAKECAADTGLWSNILVNHMAYLFKYGGTTEAIAELQAGETIEISVELDFSNPKLPKDWSVVAWAEKGEVWVTHSGGMASDKLPYTPKVGAPAPLKKTAKPAKRGPAPTLKGADWDKVNKSFRKSVESLAFEVSDECAWQFEYETYSGAPDGLDRQQVIAINPCKGWTQEYTVFMAK
jgi:hypothetical protein